MREKIRKTAELLQFAADHPDWYLEYCNGIRFDGWWWMRDSKDKSNVVIVDARATSNKTIKERFRPAGGDWRSTKYRLRRPSTRTKT